MASHCETTCPWHKKHYSVLSRSIRVFPVWLVNHRPRHIPSPRTSQAILCSAVLAFTPFAHTCIRAPRGFVSVSLTHGLVKRCVRAGATSYTGYLHRASSGKARYTIWPFQSLNLSIQATSIQRNPRGHWKIDHYPYFFRSVVVILAEDSYHSETTTILTGSGRPLFHFVNNTYFIFILKMKVALVSSLSKITMEQWYCHVYS